MSDFLLDFRPQGFRAMSRAAQALRFVEDTWTIVIDQPGFGLVIAQTGDPALWEPHCASDGSVVAIAGRVVFDESEWAGARAVEGSGGLVAGILSGRVRKLGTEALEQVNGNCGVIVYEASKRLVHMVTDPCGVFPVFEGETPHGRVYCSHPDVLADTVNERHRFDEASLAEFILAGTVTPPFTYYERVRAADHGTIFSFDLAADVPERLRKRRYFTFAYRGDAQVGEDELAGQLATALRRAVQRRTLPRLGRSAVALSGGLDSRVILASSADVERTLAFSCFDEPNRELKTAEAIARALSASFLPLRRGSDYYAEHAERGVRISGGMGSLANNHFLGVIPRLKGEGMVNLLTGCYCDYLFKGLPLNRRSHWLTYQEALAPFRHQFYFDHFAAETELADRARQRGMSRVPGEWQKQDQPSAVFEVEARRTFPLCYEGDNQQRLVPQRISGWCPPFVDRDVIEVYSRLPYTFKLNRSIFRKVVLAVAPSLRSIPDSNTGATAKASLLTQWVRSSQLRVQRKLRRLYKPGVSEESWPNWPAYVLESRGLDSLWRRRNLDAIDLFRRILGRSQVPDDIQTLKRDRPFLFVSLLTLKLWLDQRR